MGHQDSKERLTPALMGFGLWIMAVAFVVGGITIGSDPVPPEQTAKKTEPEAKRVELSRSAPKNPSELQREKLPTGQSNISKIAPLARAVHPKIEQNTDTRGEIYLVRYVDASRLNVRDGPSKKARQIWTLKRDQQVLVIDQKGVWFKVKGARFEGWAHSGFLTPNKSKPKTIENVKFTPTIRKEIPRISDATIIKILIQRSFAYYSGNCPCPYSRTARGRKCGRRSAYSRPGGASPLCYRRDVTADMIRDFRSRQ